MNRSNMMLMRSFLIGLSGGNAPWGLGWLYKIIASFRSSNFDLFGWSTCAVGKAGRTSEFRARGFRTSKDVPGPFYRSHDGEYFTAWRAVEKFFGITETESLFLFYFSSYKTNAKPVDVLTRVNALLDLKTLEQRLLFIALTDTVPLFRIQESAKENGITLPEKITTNHLIDVMIIDEDERTKKILNEIMHSIPAAIKQAA